MKVPNKVVVYVINRRYNMNTIKIFHGVYLNKYKDLQVMIELDKQKNHCPQLIETTLIE